MRYFIILFIIIVFLPADAISRGRSSGRKTRSYRSSGYDYKVKSQQLHQINNQIDSQPAYQEQPFSGYTEIVNTTYKCNGVVVTRDRFENCVPNIGSAGKVGNNPSNSFPIALPKKEKMALRVKKNNSKILSGYSISEILDSDIILAKSSEKIILYGIDAPVEGQPFHDEAENMLRKLVHKKKVTAKIYSKSKDGADIAVIFVGGKNVNELMVESGYAWIYRDSCSEAFCDDWLEREEEAKLQKIGLWNDPGRLPPWVWK